MMSNCPVCGTVLSFAFNAKVLKKYEISYWQCQECELLKTEEPYWLDEAYQSAIIDGDTGLVQRNNTIAKKIAGILYFIFNRNNSYLDVAGGYGMLTRLMRDYGFHFYWSDPYCENILAKGFEADRVQKKFEAVTAFEVLEHLEKPVDFLKKMMKQYSCKNIIFSTELYHGVVPNPSLWYYVFNEGQHISFYTPKTLKYIAKKLDLHFQSNNGIHCFSYRPINSFLYKFLTGRLNPFISFYVRKRIISLTFSDHQYFLGGRGD